MQDGELLESWRSGNRTAGEALIERHYGPVVRFFRTKAGEDADDLVQHTFLRCAEPQVVFRGTSSFRAFLFGIARNVLYEHIRSRLRDRKVDPDFAVSSAVDLNPRASTMAVRKAEQQRLIQALQRLPVELQMSLELYYWEELSVEELAVALEVPPGTIKSRLYRAREMLRDALQHLPAHAPLGDAPDVEQWSRRGPTNLPE